MKLPVLLKTFIYGGLSKHNAALIYIYTMQGWPGTKNFKKSVYFCDSKYKKLIIIRK